MCFIIDTHYNTIKNERAKAMELPDEKDLGKMNTVGYGVLSDIDIKKLLETREIKISMYGDEGWTFSEDQIQIGSIDLHFQRDYRKIIVANGETLTYERLKQHTYTEAFTLKGKERLRIEPGEIILTSTMEIIQLSSGIAGIITGRSSIARLGVMVHCGQEYINPGHGSTIPLQLVNLAPCPVELDLEIPICQLVLIGLNTPASIPYVEKKHAKYANEKSVEESGIGKEMLSISMKANTVIF